MNFHWTSQCSPSHAGTASSPCSAPGSLGIPNLRPAADNQSSITEWQMVIFVGINSLLKMQTASAIISCNTYKQKHMSSE